MSDIEASDVHHLVALASRISLPPKAGELRLSCIEYLHLLVFWFLPLSNACSRERKETRCARLLDSLANLSVAAPQHEVIAVAFCPTASSLDLLIAGNQQVPISTTDHLRSLWVSLQELSADYRRYNQLSDESTSPPQPKVSLLPAAVKKRIKKFQRTALKFCGEKLNRRFAKHLKIFQTIDVPQLSSGSSLITIQKLVQRLAHYIEARSTFQDSNWDHLWDGLELLQQLTEKIDWEDPDDVYESILNVFPLRRYLDKVVAVLKDIKILLNAANSPRRGQYFTKEFTITTVNSTDPFPFQLANSEDGWQAVIKKALQEINKAKVKQGEEEFEAVATKIKSDAQRLATRVMSATNLVHCECILLSYMLAHGSERYIRYIGVSKLCCRGCFHLIRAANTVYGTSFATKGCHHKWYYPWRIPHFPVTKESAVVKCVYGEITWSFGHMYPGFRSKTQGVLSDSESPDLSEDDQEPPPDDLEVLAQNWAMSEDEPNQD